VTGNAKAREESAAPSPCMAYSELTLESRESGKIREPSACMVNSEVALGFKELGKLR
jgi:hypothetical protein